MLDPVLPIAIYLLIGYLFKILHQDNSKVLIDFVIYFSLPAIVFSKIYPLTLDMHILKLILMFNVIILFNLALAFFIGKFLKFDKYTLATFMIMATFGNTSPLIYDLFGSFMLLVSLGIVIITWGSGGKNSVKSIFKSIFLFPPTIMFFITILAKNFEVPNFLLLTSKTLFQIFYYLQVKH